MSQVVNSDLALIMSDSFVEDLHVERKKEGVREGGVRKTAR